MTTPERFAALSSRHTAPRLSLVANELILTHGTNNRQMITPFRFAPSGKSYYIS